MKITIIGNNTGSRFYRTIPQLKYLKSLGHEVFSVKHSDRNLREYIDNSDIVIFQMVLSLDLVQYAVKSRKRVFFECDDLIHRVPPKHYAYEETRGLKGLVMLWNIYRILRLCDGFITTNKKLARIYGWMAKSSFVFPNYCSLEHWVKEKKTQDKQIRILFAGSTSHDADLLWIKPVMKNILEKNPQVKFIYIGTGGIKTDDLYAKFIYGEDLFEGLPENRESLLPYPPEVYPYIFSSLMADIAIAPLEKNYFNSCKSTCKTLEYGINKIPGVYSEWFYKSAIKDGNNGFLAKDEQEWAEKIQLLINDVNLRKQIGENAFNEVVQNNDMNKFVSEWADYVLK